MPGPFGPVLELFFWPRPILYFLGLAGPGPIYPGWAGPYLSGVGQVRKNHPLSEIQLVHIMLQLVTWPRRALLGL